MSNRTEIRYRYARIIVLAITAIFYTLPIIALKPWIPERAQKYVLTSDSGDYHRLARDIIERGQYGGNLEWDEGLYNTVYRPPGYPLYLAGIYTLFGIRPWVALLSQVVLNLLNCWLIMRITSRLFGDQSAILAGALYALNPILLRFTVRLFSEVLFLLVFSLSIYLYLIYTSGNLQRFSARWTALGTGLLMGLSATVRVVALYFGPVLAFFMIAYIWLRRRTVDFIALFLYFAGLALPIIIWSWYNHTHYGSWKLSASAEFNLLFHSMSSNLSGAPFGAPEQMQKADELLREGLNRMHADNFDMIKHPFERASYFRAVAIEKALEHPEKVASGVILGAWRLFTNTYGRIATVKASREKTLLNTMIYLTNPLIVFYNVLLLTFFAFGVSSAWKYQRFLLWMMGISYLLGIAPLGGGTHVRHAVPLYPFLLPIAGVGVLNLYNLFKGALRRTKVSATSTETETN